MALPEGGKTPWPPLELQPQYEQFREHSAWYSGDPNALADVYAYGFGAHRSGAPTAVYPSNHSIWRLNLDRFWARVTTAPWRRQMLHVPLAADIATTSADLLFSDPLALVIEEAHEDSALPGSPVVQDRLDELMEADGIQATLTEAAETSAALGGVYLRVNWDQDVEPDHPLLTSVDADMAVPEFRWGRLMACTFWRQVEAPAGNKGIWRHLERHEPGYVLHGLYEGTEEDLGMPRPLVMLGESGLQDVVETGIEQLTVVYIPNMRPNRRARGSDMGRSDYDSVEAMMDALDEVWTSWMRDLRLARARLLVPEEYFDPQGKGKGAVFDLDQEVFEKLPMAVSRDSAGMITPSQFLIRSKDHSDTATALVEQIVRSAGYAASSFGVLEQQRGVTATEIISRERRSYVTRGKKIGYWSRPLSGILQVLLAIDAKHFQPHEVFRPRVDWPEAVQEDPGQMAATIVTLRQAQAASIETAVAMAHGDWSDEEIDTEVQRITAELAAQHATGPSLSTSQPQQGDAVPGAGGPKQAAAGTEPMPAGSTSGGDSNGSQTTSG